MHLSADPDLSPRDGMMSGVAMKTWADTLEEACKRAAAIGQGSRADLIRKGISRGVEMGDTTLLTKEFAVRLQLISLLKNGQLCAAVWLDQVPRDLTSQFSKCQIIRVWKRGS